MATEFTYSIQNDFPNQAVDASVLTVEVGDAAIVPALDGININGDDVTLEFDADLSAPEVTTLDGVIAVHAGVPFNDNAQRINVIAAQDNTTTLWEEAARLDADPVGAEQYALSFYCELRKQGGNNNSRSQFRLLVDGSEVAAGGIEKLEFFDARSGNLVISTNRGSSPSIVMEFQRAGATAATAQIRRVRLALIPLLSEDED
jgi:hypothetical protein